MTSPSFSRREITQLLAGTAVFAPVFAATYGGAFMLRFSGELSQRYADLLFGTIGWVLFVKCVVFLWFRVHQGWTRYVSFHDLVVLGQAVTAGAVGVMLVDTLLLPQYTIPRSVVLIDWGMTLMAVGAARAVPRLMRDDGWRLFTSPGGVASLIVGANDSGEALLRTIRCNPALNYRVVGFVDDRPGMQGRRIGGVPVVGTCKNLSRLVKRGGVEEVLITAGELPGKQVRKLVDAARRHRFRVKVLPSYEQLLAERVAVTPRSVAIEDLLCRQTVEMDLEGLRDWLSDRVVMVTGSAGSIGSEICRQVLKLQPAKLVAVDRAETPQFHLEQELRRLAPKLKLSVRLGDINDRGRLDALLREVKPDVVFHAAAYKHVPLMEAHCGEAVKNIVLATRSLVDLAEEHGVQSLVMISTDKAVNPTSVMGSCKRLAEQYVQARSHGSACKFVTVRFGNVLDSSGSVVPIFREQIARGGPVTVTHPEITRYFMLIREAAQLVIQSGAMGQGGEIFVLDMGEPVRILDLAHDMIRLSGLRVGDDIEVQTIGLRPGEKLIEELYDDHEVRHATPHPKIMMADSAKRNLIEVIHEISRLDDVADEPNEIIRTVLREIIPLHSVRETAHDTGTRRAAA